MPSTRRLKDSPPVGRAAAGQTEVVAPVRPPAFGKLEPTKKVENVFVGRGPAVAPGDKGHVDLGPGFQLGGAAPVDDRAFDKNDAAATGALATLAKAFADPAMKKLLGDPCTLTTADLSTIARKGTLRDQDLGAVASKLAPELAAAATFLTARTHAPYLAQIAHSKEITAASVTAAQAVGFYAPHQAILEKLLGAFAKSAPATCPPGVGDQEHAFTLKELKAMLATGATPNGKTLETAIPNATARHAFVDAVSLIVNNPAVFKQLDLSGKDPMPNMPMTNGKFSVTDLNHLLSSDNPLPGRPDLKKLVRATLPQTVPPFVKPHEISELPPAKRAELAKLYTQWADQTNMVAHHEAWHKENGSGGTKGPKSGEKFIQFHAQMGDEFKQYLLDLKPPRTDMFDEHGLLPTWDTTKPLPKEFLEGCVKSSIDWKMPGFLSATPVKGETFTLDGRVITCLNDIKSPDELGRVWGESGAHAVAHNRLGDEMASFASVRDPAFLLWHFGVIETSRAEWLNTDSGKAWQKDHPSGWTDPNVDAGRVNSMPKGVDAASRAPRYPDKTPFWTDDQIREAGVGFTDPKLKAAAQRRVETQPRPN